MSDEGKKKGMLSRFAESLLEEADKYLPKGLGGKAAPRESSLSSESTHIPDSDKLVREVRSEIEKRGVELKKFLEIAESLEEIVPEEDKRYNAAVKALKSASGLTMDDVIKGADSQLAELKRQRDIFAKSIARRRGDLRNQSAKAKDVREQMALLRENIKRLEEEEKRIAVSVAAENDKISAAEESFGEVVNRLEEEIAGVKGNILAYISGAVSEEPPPPPPEETDTGVYTGVTEEVLDVEDVEEPEDLTEKISERIEQPPPQGDVYKQKGVRVCPVCNNKMEWFEMSKLWRCFVCGEEEKS